MYNKETYGNLFMLTDIEYENSQNKVLVALRQISRNAVFRKKILC